jgi:hypothetical protein
MSLKVEKELAALGHMTIAQLRARYAELSGDATDSRNRHWLIRRIIWRMQSDQEGGLSERAIQRARELAQGADLRVTAPQPPKPTSPSSRTVTKTFTSRSRVPIPGSRITRRYKGRTIEVLVLRDGFEFEGEIYSSLSAIAKHVTGSHWNGFRFFNLPSKGAC